ncbi:MAG: hypothetical protein PVF58_01280 [Candidatus Methanofastidiosia archaeon]
MKYVATEYPLHVRVMSTIAALLPHAVYGKVIGILLMGIPAIVVIFQVITSFPMPNVVTLLLIIPVTYGGLFLAAFLHEMGHVVVLRSMGCKTKTTLLYNYHNPLLLFNMRTEMTEDHPIHSSATFLLKRGLSGVSVNIFLNIFFLVLSVYFGSVFFAYLAFLQGFGSHGATSLSPATGDSDVRTLATAVEAKDEVTVTVTENEYTTIDIKTNIHLRNIVETTYWVLIEGLKNPEGEHKNFLAFDMPNSIMFLLRNFETGSHSLSVHGERNGPVTVYTRGGRIFSISS